MKSEIREFVLNHPLFSHHDHHCNFRDFEKHRSSYTAESLLGYANADLVTAAEARPDAFPDRQKRLAALWPKIRTTGYGRAVTLGCRALFDLEYCPENFPAVTEMLKSKIKEMSPSEVYDHFVAEKADNSWILQDGHFRPGNEKLAAEDVYPDYYRFAWRMDELFTIPGPGPLESLQRATGTDILCLDDLVDAMNSNIDTFMATDRLAAFKIGVAYQRDLAFSDPTRHEAECAFNRIRNRKIFHDGIQQNSGSVNAREARPLADYLFHKLMQRANAEDVPVQIHTGYLAGNWGSLAGTKALNLVPIFEKYRRVRFDVFHASWPWTSELGAIAKNYPNVYPDLCWAWTMNPSESERALSEWLDGIPFNKIFAYGSDTGLPWCNAGYSIQARLGIARVLEQKIQKGFFSEQTAEEVASAIMLKNGENFHRLS